MKCTKCDNEAMENEVLCAECAAKERNINNEEQMETEKLTEEVKVEITSTEVENSEDNHVITEQDVPQAANSVPAYVPTASPAYDGFSMNQDAATHEEKRKESIKKKKHIVKILTNERTKRNLENQKKFENQKWFSNFILEEDKDEKRKLSFRR